MGLGRFCGKRKDNVTLLDFIKSKTLIKINGNFIAKFKFKPKLKLIKRKELIKSMIMDKEVIRKI